MQDVAQYITIKYNQNMDFENFKKKYNEAKRKEAEALKAAQKKRNTNDKKNDTLDIADKYMPDTTNDEG